MLRLEITLVVVFEFGSWTKLFHKIYMVFDRSRSLISNLILKYLLDGLLLLILVY